MSAVSPRFRRLALSLVPALALIGTTSLPAHASVPAPPNAYLGINEYSTPLPTGNFDIITGPDGNIWYSSPNFDDVIKASPADGSTLGTVVLGDHSPSCAPTGLTIGPDKNIWVACFNGSSVVRITPGSLAKKSYKLPSTAASLAAGCTCPEFLTSGPDGYLWFTENGPGYITKLNVTTGALHRYVLPAGNNADPRGITVGSDGKIWFTEAFINRIGRMTTSGVLTAFAVPTASSVPWGIAPGPDGALYYTELQGNKIGRITTSGSTSEFTIPSANSGPRMINVGPDGNLWFAEYGPQITPPPSATYGPTKIGSMTPDGVFQDVALPSANSQAFGVAAGPDGNLWFTELNANNIGKIGTRHTTLTLDKTAIGFGNIGVNATTAAQRITLTNNGAESLAAFTPSVTPVSGAGGIFNRTETCSAGPIAAGGSCYEDVTFTAGSNSGGTIGRSDFLTDGGTAFQQKLTAGVDTNVNAAVCKSVAISTSVASPQVVGQAVGITALAAGCPNTSPRYRFYLRSPAGVWSIVQDFGLSDTFAWDTSTYTAGTYLIGVWTKDAFSSTTTYDAYAFGTFTLTFPNCTSTNVTSDVASPQASGTTVNFTATSLGCPNPLYQWWVRNAAGVWTIVPGHDFAHSSGTFAWNTTGLADGTYQVGVWAKQTGSTKSYEAYSFITYTLAPPITGTTQCRAVNVTPDVTSPQNIGTTVTFTATPVLGCDTPQYKWWVRNTAGIWTVVKDYPVGTSTYAWSTGSLPAGTYQVGVWVRQTGSSASYEAYSFVTYTLTIAPAAQPCTSVGITSDVASPQPMGATVTFTGAAIGCPSPTYKFFIAPPGGAFTEVQAYGIPSTLVWDTTGFGPGPYQVGVWARNAGSTKSYEAFAFITFQLTGNVPCSTLSIFPTAHGWTTNNILSQSPQPAGITVVWSAASACDITPQYAFYVQGPSSTYKVLRSYGAGATASWNTSGLPRGNYNIKVLVRNTGSTSPYEVFVISTYELV